MVTNFDCASRSGVTPPASYVVDSLRWMAPECIDNLQSDIWTFGITVLVLCLFPHALLSLILDCSIGIVYVFFLDRLTVPLLCLTSGGRYQILVGGRKQLCVPTLWILLTQLKAAAAISVSLTMEILLGGGCVSKSTPLVVELPDSRFTLSLQPPHCVLISHLRSRHRRHA